MKSSLFALLSVALLAAPTFAQIQGEGEGEVPAAVGNATHTLFLARIVTANHVRDAQSLVGQLKANTPLQRWHVLHGEGQSMLYYGYYSSPDAADADREQLGRVLNGVGDPMFTRILLVPLDAPDPAAPPQWDLTQASGRYSVIIAGYKGPGRKQITVDSVRAAREQGVEAYYWHGPTISHIAIGTWGAEAISIRNENPQLRDTSDDGRMLVSNVPLPEHLRRTATDEMGRPMPTVTPELKINDLTLKQTMQLYPRYAVNGEDQQKTLTDDDGQQHVIFQPSYIVDLTQIERAAPTADPGMMRDNDPAPQLLNPNAGRRRGGLRSLD